MRSGNTIYNLDGQPFRSYDTAKRMRDLLIGETGCGYQIAPYHDGGFYIFIDDATLPHPITLTADVMTNTTEAIQNQPNIYELRPAVVRSNLFTLALMLISAVLVLTVDQLFAIALHFFSFSATQLGDWYGRITGVVTGLGILLMVTSWIGILWQRASALFRITEFGVESRTGIFAYQTSGLRYQDISFMTVQQSALERLLSIGGVEFRSAGSAGVPVRFYPISNPANVLKVVQERMAVSAH